MTRLRFAHFACLSLFVLASVASVTPANANFAWEDQFVDEEALVNGSSVTADGHVITFTTSVFSDSDGGTFDLTPAINRNPEFFAYEAGASGNQTGNLELAFDNENRDPADYLQITMAFTEPATELAFSVLDLDASPIRYWDDGVEIYFNGTNLRTNPSLYNLGNAIFLDNENYMFGFEGGSTPAGPNQTLGNIDINFGGIPISTVTIKYFSTDDAINNPSPQFIGVSDLSYTAIPEPNGDRQLLLAALCAFTFARWR